MKYLQIDCEALIAEAAQIFGDIALPIQEGINRLLQPYIGPFKAETASIITLDGHKTKNYSTVIHNYNCEKLLLVPIDSVAVVIDAYEDLTIEILQQAYQRIEQIKSVKKTDRAGPPSGDVAMTTSMIVARNSNLTLEQISTKINQLNDSVPSHRWPDAVVVLNKGIVNYTAHVPGRDSTGDFFLPSESTSQKSPVPSIHVQKTIRPGNEQTFNKLASLVVCRLAIYQPEISFPNYNDFIPNFPSFGVVTQTYQFNLANLLMPMTREEIFAEQLPQKAYNIMVGKEKLGSVQFQKWQDGGVFVICGKFPIDLFLIFLKEVVPGLNSVDLQFFRNEEVQVSYVLPMDQREFIQTLNVFQQRSSNITIQEETTKKLVQRISGEGATSPFVARLMIGMLNIRDIAFYQKDERDNFDKLYEPVLTSLRNVREIAKDIDDRWKEHVDKIVSGAIISVQGSTIHINESIDRNLKRDLESFLNTVSRILKQQMQALAKEIGVDFGFLFKKEIAFLNGISTMRSSDPILANYLENVRIWSEPLIFLRNDLEHGTISLPRVKYDLENHPIEAFEPQIDHKPITVFTAETIDRVACFVEEVTTHCLQKRMPSSLNITEISNPERNIEAPERFLLTITPGGAPPWVLSAHQRKFEEV